MTSLNKYVLGFFIKANGIPDPALWYRKEVEWGKWLKVQNLSGATIRKVIGTANRFGKFLIDYVYPDDMSTPRKLNPIGKKDLKELHEKTSEEAKYIKKEMF